MRRRLVWIAYALVLTAAIFALRQMWLYRYDTALLATKDQIGSSIKQVENLVQASINHVNMLRISADDSLSDLKVGRISVSPLYTHIRAAPEIGGYCSTSEGPAHSRIGVSLSGLGLLPGPGTQVADEINMALMLTPQFAATAENIPNLAWAYYTSAQRFIAMFPLISCQDFHFDDSLINHDFFRLGTPELNPDRTLFWTPAYMDEAGKGLMATIGAPVYDGSRFLGTVSIDLTLKVLSDYVRGSDGTLGTSFVVNEQGQVLAHPTLIGPADTAAHGVDQAFGIHIAEPMEFLSRIADGEFVAADGALVYSSRLRGAPWRYVYVTSKTAMLWRAIADSKIEIAGFLLLVLLIAAFERSRRVGFELKRNIDELKQTQTNLKAERDRAERAEQAAHEANRAKSVMLANASHDLRTPLNAIIGFSELVLSGPYGPLGNRKYAEYVRDIHSSGNLLLSIVNDVLDLSKIEAGRYEMKEREINVAELVDTSTKLVGTQAADSGVEVHAEVAADLPLLWADLRAMQQILLNLLSNGIKFTPTGGSVLVRAATIPDGGLQIQVSDTGGGISSTDLPMLFTPFSRGAAADTAKTQGTGLGLSIVKSLVQLHGGTVTIASTPGAGTTVVISLPADRMLQRSDPAAA